METPRTKNISEGKISQAVAIMSEMIPFFPRDPGTHVLISKFLFDMAWNDQQIDWLTLTACQVIPKWEGFQPLRGLFCSRFTPADGLPEVDALIQGFRAADLEREHFEREAAETELRIEQWKREQKQLNAALALPAAEESELAVDPNHRHKFEPAGSDGLFTRCACGLVARAGAVIGRASELRGPVEITANVAELKKLPPAMAPTRIGPTPVRTEAERAEILRQMESQIAAMNAAEKTA